MTMPDQTPRERHDEEDDGPEFSDPEILAKIREGKAYRVGERKDNKVVKPSAVDRAVVAFEVPKGLFRNPNAKFEQAVARRIKLYGCDALDAVHDLACMKTTDNWGMMQVKVQAAKFLIELSRQGVTGAPGNDSILATLNDSYRANAPRIKSVRERVIEFDTEPSAILPS